MEKLKSIRIQLIFFLVLFAYYLSVVEGSFRVLFFVLLSSLCAMATESLILYFRMKELRLTSSSILTGLIVGYVLSADTHWWFFTLASVLAISSKYLLRFHNKHIFNPASFGLLIVTLFLRAPTTWHGTYLWYILLPFGFYFVFRIRKIEILIGFAFTFSILFGAQAIIQNRDILAIFNYLSYFYIFIMVVDPKTTPIRPLGKLIFGAAVVALLFILEKTGAEFNIQLVSLLAVNACVPLLNKIPAPGFK